MTISPPASPRCGTPNPVGAASAKQEDFELLVREFGARAFARTAGAWVKDGIHHMAVALKHDGEGVVAIRGRTLAYPWTTCPDASSQLSAFVGTDLFDKAKPQPIDQRTQCTHLLDLARLALKQAKRGGSTRFRMTIQRTLEQGAEVLRGSAERNGERLLHWEITDYVVSAPQILSGHRIDGRAVFPEGYLVDDDLFEAAMMLRRAVKMFRGRDRANKMVNDIAPKDRNWMMGACYTFQPGVAAEAKRVTLDASV